jgi:hypothetical protein
MALKSGALPKTPEALATNVEISATEITTIMFREKKLATKPTMPMKKIAAKSKLNNK